MSESKYFTVDARTVLALGRESIKDHTTAVLELVKNSYDAGATVVDVEINGSLQRRSKQSIRITDDGHGMTEEDIDAKWLRIGFSEKRRFKRTRRRRRVGEKGVGRLSADRLGALLELHSQAKNADAVGLRISWNEFDSPGTDLVSIPVATFSNASFLVPVPSVFSDKAQRYLEPSDAKPNGRRTTGTEIIVRNLRQKWSPEDVEDLHEELAILTPPFGGVTDFQVRLSSDVHPEFNGVVESPFFDTAEIEALFSFAPARKIRSTLKSRDARGKLAKPVVQQTSWRQFVHRVKNGQMASPKFGRVSVRLLFYPRIAETLRGTDLTLGQLRDFLDVNAGVKVYRDNIRVMPYGDLKNPEGGDWLGLGERKAQDPAGAGRSAFRIAPNQLVGAVFLTRDGNPKLVDTSGREGLVHAEEFIQLKTFLLGCLFRLEAYYHQLFTKKKAREGKPQSPRQTVREFGVELKRLREDLRDVKEGLPKKAERRIEQVEDTIGTAFEHIDKVQKSMEELASQSTTYRSLASLGIAAATFSHETDAALEQFMTSLLAAQNILSSTEPDVDEALDELEKSIVAAERISTWGRFTLRRIKPDKRRRRKISVTEIVLELLQELRPAFQSSEIDLRSSLSQIEGRFFAMDIESIVLNLLTNAYYFAKVGRRTRAVSLSLRKLKKGGRPGVSIIVADSGPGVGRQFTDQIWTPLFSSKVDKRGRAFGTGLGLSIIDDVVAEHKGSRQVSRDDLLLGARFEIWLPLQ